MTLYSGYYYARFVCAPSWPTLCNSMDCRLPGSSVCGIFQARILEWVAISLPQGIFPTQGSKLCPFAFAVLADRFFTSAPPGKMLCPLYRYRKQAERGAVTCLWSLSQWVAELGLELEQSGSRVHALQLGILRRLLGTVPKAANQCLPTAFQYPAEHLGMRGWL